MTARVVLMLLGWVGTMLAMAPGSAAWAETVRIDPDENLQAAVDRAPEGATLELAAGRHRGPVRIRKPMTLRGEDGARLHGAGEGSVLTIEADDVRIEGFAIAGSGRDLSKDDAGVLVLGDGAWVERVRFENNLHGIYVRGGNDARLTHNAIVGLAATEDQPDVKGASGASQDDGIHHRPPGARALMGNGIHLWNASDAVIENNRIRHARDGIYVAHCDDSRFRGNRVHDSRYGIHYMYSHRNVLHENELWRNVAGAALMFSRHLEVTDNVLRDHGGFRAYGLLLQDVDASNFRGNVMRGNRVGVRLQNSNANVFRDNRIVGNITGIRIGSASRENALSRNRIGPNLHQVELTGPTPPTRWSVDGVGNRWHGAMPMDLNGDGVSEWPHHEVDLLAEKRDRFPAVQLLTASPGIRALEWALRRAPVPGMRYITDPDPLTAGGER